MRRLFITASCAACLLLAASARVAAQQQPPPVKPPANPIPDARHHSDEDADQSSSHTDEMLKAMAIRRDEASYKENLDRAKETAQLGAELRDAFKQQHALTSAEMKKLARVEKLARSIRNDAGGDDDDTTLADPPATLAAALDRLADMCDEFKKKVEGTPRHVVSAAVINSANQLIELTRLIKTLGG